MPRLTFDKPLDDPTDGDSAKRRREVKRDGVVVALKAATFAVVIALVGAVVLLLTAGDGEPRAKAPSVPEIKSTHTPDDAAPASTPGFVAPEVRTQTAELSVAPPPPPTTTTTTTTTTEETRPTRPTDEERFVTVGKRCDTPGAYAFTKRYEPVVCAAPGPTWRRLFR